jgi:hypothetical protein
MYFKLTDNKINDDDKVTFITTFIRGEAEQWITPYVKKFVDKTNDDPKVNLLFESLLHFKEQICRVFRIANKKKKAKKAI